MGGGVTMSKTVEEHFEQVKEAYTNLKEVLLWAYWDKDWVETASGETLTDDEWSDVCDHDFDWSDINEQISAIVSDIIAQRDEQETEKELIETDTELWEA
jgi:hypothetical protein